MNIGRWLICAGFTIAVFSLCAAAALAQNGSGCIGHHPAYLENQQEVTCDAGSSIR